MRFLARVELLTRPREFTIDRTHLARAGSFPASSGGYPATRRASFGILVKAGRSTEAFVGTRAAVGFPVDGVRIAIYGEGRGPRRASGNGS